MTYIILLGLTFQNTYLMIENTLKCCFHSVPDLFNFWASDVKCEGFISPSEITALRWEFIVVWIINAVSGFVCYFCARTAAKVDLYTHIYSFISSLIQMLS